MLLCSAKNRESMCINYNVIEQLTIIVSTISLLVFQLQKHQIKLQSVTISGNWLSWYRTNLAQYLQNPVMII